jgi:HK97 family phage portal protein
VLQSQGVLKTVTLWQGTTATFPGWSNIPTLNAGRYWSAYDTMYSRQPWVSAVVNKLGSGEARLPLKVYQRGEDGRPEARDHPYAQLLRNPHPRMNRFFFWLWVIGTFDVYGEAFLLKQRDTGGRPIALLPLHPANMREVDRDGPETIWEFRNGTVVIERIRDSDLVHPKTYNPATLTRGLSRLEPLRRTLEFEDAAQRAQSSFWSKGARPGVALSHPGSLSQDAADRLKVRWDALAAGADNTGTTIVLEEGMKPEIMSISNEDAQYIDSRKLNRGEVCAVYDVPPPAVHILDDATFSNITEQFRSLYRDTHAPRLQLFESCLETELRASIRPGASEPDFGDDVYAEFLLDEVLRGDFEARADAYQKAINSGWMEPAEVRRAENLPFVDGSDTLLVNSTLVPIATAIDPPALPEGTVRTVMGRLSRQKTLDDVDMAVLTAGIEHPQPIIDTLDRVRITGGGVPELRAAIKTLEAR